MCQHPSLLCLYKRALPAVMRKTSLHVCCQHYAINLAVTQYRKRSKRRGRRWSKVMENNLPVSIIIFGASGDLTQRKLVPSLFNLYRKGRMPKRFHMVGYGGTAFTDEQFS